MRVPFVIYHDEFVQVQGLPSGFLVSTRKAQLFIDGGSHLSTLQQKPVMQCLWEFEYIQKAIAKDEEEKS